MAPPWLKRLADEQHTESGSARRKLARELSGGSNARYECLMPSPPLAEKVAKGMDAGAVSQGRALDVLSRELVEEFKAKIDLSGDNVQWKRDNALCDARDREGFEEEGRTPPLADRLHLREERCQE